MKNIYIFFKKKNYNKKKKLIFFDLFKKKNMEPKEQKKVKPISNILLMFENIFELFSSTIQYLTIQDISNIMFISKKFLGWVIFKKHRGFSGNGINIEMMMNYIKKIHNGIVSLVGINYCGKKFIGFSDCDEYCVNESMIMRTFRENIREFKFYCFIEESGLNGPFFATIKPSLDKHSWMLSGEIKLDQIKIIGSDLTKFKKNKKSPWELFNNPNVYIKNSLDDILKIKKILNENMKNNLKTIKIFNTSFLPFMENTQFLKMDKIILDDFLITNKFDSSTMNKINNSIEPPSKTILIDTKIFQLNIINYIKFQKYTTPLGMINGIETFELASNFQNNNNIIIPFNTFPKLESLEKKRTLQYKTFNDYDFEKISSILELIKNNSKTIKEIKLYRCLNFVEIILMLCHPKILFLSNIFDNSRENETISIKSNDNDDDEELKEEEEEDFSKIEKLIKTITDEFNKDITTTKKYDTIEVLNIKLEKISQNVLNFINKIEHIKNLRFQINEINSSDIDIICEISRNCDEITIDFIKNDYLETISRKLETVKNLKRINLISKKTKSFDITRIKNIIKSIDSKNKINLIIM